MKVNIKATNLKLTPALEDFIHKKVGGLDKFISHPDAGIQAFVEVERLTHHRTSDIFCAEIQIPLPHKKQGLRAEVRHEDLYTAVEQARNELKEELQKTKDKKIALVRRGARILKNLVKNIPFIGE